MDIVVNLPDTDYSVMLTKILLACPGRKVIELPKGHGRLIDASELNVALLMGELYGNKTAIKVIDEAQTIIEADREEQE